MEFIDQDKYLKGKKQFRILAILNMQMFLMSDIMFAGNSKGPIGITQVMFFTRMYWGEIWPIYFVIVLSILEGIDNFMMMARLFKEIDWIIYVWPEMLIIRCLRIVVCLSVCQLAIFKKELRYFIKVHKMKNKKRKAKKNGKKDNDEETNMKA
ncbi:hypothetical protein D3Z50_11690 [Clostridiaceae bacterium]|nr:hypothetical protein [Clostridiaceae bacterium]